MGVSDILTEECHLEMLHYNMHIGLLIVHTKRVEDARAKRKDRDSKRTRTFEGGATKDRLGIIEKTRFKKRFSNQVPSKFPKAREERDPRPRVQKGKSGKSSNEKQPCKECGKKHFCAYLLRSDKCFCCGKIAHKV